MFCFPVTIGIGRGGIILTDNKEAAVQLKKMSYDGRLPDIPWRNQNINTVGYHYYMTPETAQLGLDKLPDAIKTKPHQWKLEDWPDLTQMDIFKNTYHTGYIFESAKDPNIIKKRKFGNYDHFEYCKINNIDPYLQTK